MPDYATSLSLGKVHEMTASRKRFPVPASRYIGEAWNMVTSDFAPYLGFVLVWGVLYFILALIPIVGNIAPAILNALFLPGFSVYAFNKRMNGQAQFDDFFTGFKHAGPLVGVMFLTVFIMIVGVLPMVVGILLMDGMAPGGMDGAMEGPLFLLFILLMIITTLGLLFLSVCFSFASPLVVFGGMSATDALSASYRIIKTNFWGVFGLMILCYFITILGVLPCLLGLLITIPVVSVAFYLLFEEAFGLGDAKTDGDELDDIMRHLV